MIDFHCHLDLYPNYSEIVRECERRGMYVLSVTTTPSAWRGTSALAMGSKRIRTALGLHPQLAGERKGELVLFDGLLPQTLYVGEIGLDGSPEFRKSWKDQLNVFEHILAQCRKAGGRVMSIHSRRASEAVLDCLEKEKDAGTPVLHWFSGSPRDLDRAIRLGCWFSIGPAMLQGERGRALVARMPPSRVLTESDGPFALIDGQAMKPWQVGSATDGLAQIWSTSPPDADRQLIENFKTLLGAEVPQ